MRYKNYFIRKDERFTVGCSRCCSTLNLDILRCRLEDYVKELYQRAAQLFFLIYPIRSLFSDIVFDVAVVVP